MLRRPGLTDSWRRSRSTKTKLLAIVCAGGTEVAVGSVGAGLAMRMLASDAAPTASPMADDDIVVVKLVDSVDDEVEGNIDI